LWRAGVGEVRQLLQVGLRPRIARVDLEGLLESLAGFVALAGLRERGAEVDPGAAEAGVELDGSLVFRDGAAWSSASCSA